MTKYKKDRLVIEAVQFLASKQSFDDILDMGNVDWKPGEIGNNSFYIKNMYGEMVRVNSGDWVCKHSEGVYNVCDSRKFKSIYEKIKEE